MKTPGQVAFEAYNEAKGGVTWDGKPIPPWGEVGEEVQQAWKAAAEAAVGLDFVQVAAQAHYDLRSAIGRLALMLGRVKALPPEVFDPFSNVIEAFHDVRSAVLVVGSQMDMIVDAIKVRVGTAPGEKS